MNLKISKWINVLSILLALLAMGELIFTASTLYLVSIILSKTGGYLTTVCGFIASLVVMPTAFKVRSFYSSMEIRVHHFDMQSYHRYMLYISLGIQTICIIVCCVSFTQHHNTERAITSAIMRYKKQVSEKKFMDIIQFLFQCCGSTSFEDWAQEDWISRLTREILCPGNKISLYSSRSGEENMKLLYALPYSCCKVESLKPCRNFDIQCSGLETLNTKGCLDDLNEFIDSILLSEFAIFSFINVIIIVLLKLLLKEEYDISQYEDEDYESVSEVSADEKKLNVVEWQKFTNSETICISNSSDEEKIIREENYSSTGSSGSTDECSCASAKLVPTSQEQLLLNKNKKAELVSTSRTSTASKRKSSYKGKLKSKSDVTIPSKKMSSISHSSSKSRPKESAAIVQKNTKVDNNDVSVCFPSKFPKKVSFE